MKRHIYYILFWSIFFTSCEDYLDKSPDMGIDEDYVFSNYANTRGYLDKCFNLVADYTKWNDQGADRAHLGQISDEAANSYVNTPIANIINKGEWLGKADKIEVGWEKGKVQGNAFAGLRISNRIISKVPPMTMLSESEKNQLLGQAYFFRAWFYFEIVRRVGGMPLIDKVFASDDEMDVPRLSYKQSTDWIITQLNMAISHLPERWEESEKGRPTKVAAYALKSMAELYAASPLMQNPIDRLEQFVEYDIERAKNAAQYAKECLDYIDSNVPEHRIMDDYKHIFYHSPNFVSDESLWYLNSVGQNRDGSADLPVHWQNVEFCNRKGNYGQANVSLSQNMVDKFETVNGYPVELKGSEWITSDPDFDPANPYENRDPRLSNNVICPGEQFGSISNKPNYLCTWENGRDVKRNAVEVVRTRYLVKKWQWPECVNTRLSDGKAGYGLYYYNCILIRTTQVWLDYAEAMNEAYGPTEIPAGYTYSAVDAINKIRNRVGMCNVRNEYTSNKVDFRDRIRNERAVELLLENHRWFDIRRWMIAEKIFSEANPIRGVKVTASNATASQPKDGNVFTYEELLIPDEIRVFTRKHYWYPVGKDEADRMLYFKQNPGW